MVQWENPELAANATWTVTLVVAAPLTTTANLVENATYSARSDEVTAVFGPTVQTTITPWAHALALHKAASASEIDAGDALTYTLTVTHEHPGLPTTNVVLTDVLPAHTTLITATMPFTQDGDMIYWHAPIMAAGEIWQVQLVVNTAVSNTVYVVSNEHYGVRSHEVTTTVIGPPVITFVGIPFKLYIPIIMNP
jgi:uncharacterized repeat protein (TIGR01451 family)